MMQTLLQTLENFLTAPITAVILAIMVLWLVVTVVLARVMLGRVNAALRVGDNEAALRRVRPLVATDGINMGVLAGTIAWRAGDTETALAYLDRVIRKKPQHMLARITRAQVYADMKAYNAAEDELDAAARSHPHDARVWVWQTELELERERHEAARGALTTGLERIQPQLAALTRDGGKASRLSAPGIVTTAGALYFYRAVFAGIDGRDDWRALMEEALALTLQSEHSDVVHTRALIYNTLERYAEGVEAADLHIVKADASVPITGYLHRGVGLFGLARYAEALAAFETARLRHRTHPLAVAGVMLSRFILTPDDPRIGRDWRWVCLRDPRFSDPARLARSELFNSPLLAPLERLGRTAAPAPVGT